MSSTAIPQVVQPTFNWAGNDGNWSTWQVSVGSPRQSFEVLPSISGNDVWVPISGACSPYSFPWCASSRGILSTSGSADPGFYSNASSSWHQIGIYGLSLENNLFGDADSGLYGLDTVSLGTNQVSDQMVAAFATNDFWIGSLGLGVQPSHFDVQQQNISTLLVSMKVANMTPSQSYGFAAGAFYREGSAAGGLVIGGYDVDAFTPSNISFPLNFNLSRSLTVSLRGLVVSHALSGTPSGTVALTTASLNMSLDSTVAHIWLPGSVCDAFAANLGLIYEAETGLYLINNTIRSQLRAAAAQFTFTIAANGSTGETTNIVLPYAAFDQEVGLPTYNSSTPYFPIRRGANETQFVLGRTFLQEAYVVVDWDRQNFTIGQSLHRNGVSSNIMPILPPVDSSNSTSGLSSGAIAGVVIGPVVIVVFFCLGAWFWRKKRRTAAATSHLIFYGQKKVEPELMNGTAELPSPPPAPRHELTSEQRHELHEDQVKHQLMSNAVYELPGETPELDSGEVPRAELR